MQEVKPKRADGYALCRGIGTGYCSCEHAGRDPCSSIRALLVSAGCDVEAAVEMELHRINMEIPVQ